MSEARPITSTPAVAGRASASAIPNHISSIRRKPQHTYQSPSTTHVSISLRLEGPAPARPSSSADISSSRPKFTSAKPLSTTPAGPDKAPKKKYHLMGPPLSLYHPLGKLALSLPDLDPTALGLAAPLAPHADEAQGSRRASVRARRPTTKLLDAIAGDDTVTPHSTAVPVLLPVSIGGTSDKDKDKNDENKEKEKEKTTPSKRKRASGGGKRKRREADEDASYPAKRPRNPRRTGQASRAGSASPSMEATEHDERSGEKEKQPERRTTRSSGQLRRRDSSESAATAASVSVVAPGVNGKMNGVVAETMTTVVERDALDAVGDGGEMENLQVAAKPNENENENTPTPALNIQEHPEANGDSTAQLDMEQDQNRK